MFQPIAFTAVGYEGAYDGTGHGITVSVTDPAEGAVVTYSRTEDDEYTTTPILFTNVTDGAQSVYYKIAAVGYATTNGVATATVTPKALTAEMVGDIATEYVYTGAAHEPPVTVADVPPRAITESDYTVTYADNVNAGVGRAIVTGKGNYAGVVEKTFTIRKADYDMSGVAWGDSSAFVYDKTAKSVVLSGLPAGVEATYQGNVATEAGAYTATATFAYDAANYNAPSVGDCAWGIKPKSVTVTAAAKQVVYGEPDAPLTFAADGLCAGDALAGELVREPGADAGTYAITVGTLANSNYAITFVPADYAITPRDVTLTSDSAEKPYDGTALTRPNIIISGLGWATGEGATFEVTGSQTDVGSSANTFTYALNGNTKAANYAITTVEGTLTVTPNPIVTDVTARQRYPWNGKVDIFFSVAGVGTEARKLSVWAVDQTTGITNVATAVTGDTEYASGQHKIVWDMAADGLTLVSTNVVFGVSYVEKVKDLYCVIDLSGGTSAASYPVTYLGEVPAGGWSDEYKTTKLVLRKISAGTFTMGSPTDELGRYDNEAQHQVTLTKDYYVGVFEVTQRQWELVMGTRPSHFNNNACYASRPVEQISYNMIRGSSNGAGWPNSSDVDATSFLGVLRAKSGLTLDLPTEAQWEYACRAGTTTALNSGKNLTNPWDQDSEMDKVGRYWYNGGSNYSQSVDTSGATAKVGSYAPNAWGLYDMHGNVYEWCIDWYGAYSGDATDPKGSSSGSGRVLRGGSCYHNAYYCRSAYRGYSSPSFVSYGSGFRVVRTLTEDAEAEPAARSEAAAATSGASDPVRVDLTAGTRTAAESEVLTYSTEWDNEVKVRGEMRRPWRW